jgi:lysyl endopeptidase
MKQFFSFLLSLMFTSVLVAQIGHGGQPVLKPGKHLDNIVRKIHDTDPLPAQVQHLAGRLVGRKGDALRFAHPFFVSMTPENSGVWTTQSDGTRIWRLGIRSNGAYSINLIFDRFNLVPGVSVYLFNPGQSLVLGAFTHLNNLPSGVLATAPIPGDELIVELHIPKGITKTSELMIGAINHDYLNLFPYLKGGDFGDSGSCQVDFTCSAEGFWNDVGRSVCKMIVDGTELCTGTLLNNTRNDGKPYVLTAGHCVEDASQASTVLFYFNYQVPNCEASIEGVATQTLSGSFLRAYAEALDFALIEMSAVPPASYQPFWAGWSRTSTPSSSVKAIHHPEGDVKKVALSGSAPIATTFSATSPGGVTFLTNSHWRVPTWASGTTEPGSSGCGLFDFDGLLLGSLSGGEAYCGHAVNDYFAPPEQGLEPLFSP